MGIYVKCWIRLLLDIEQGALWAFMNERKKQLGEEGWAKNLREEIEKSGLLDFVKPSTHRSNQSLLNCKTKRSSWFRVCRSVHLHIFK